MLSVSTGRLVAQYALYLIGGTLAAIALIWAIETYGKMELQSSAMGFLVIYAAASGLGSFWWKREADPASPRRWRVALFCGLLTVALQGALMALIVAGGVALGEFTLGPQDGKIFAGIMAGLAVLVVLLIRFALGMGLRQAARVARQRAERAARVSQG